MSGHIDHVESVNLFSLKDGNIHWFELGMFQSDSAYSGTKRTNKQYRKQILNFGELPFDSGTLYLLSGVKGAFLSMKKGYLLIR